MRTEGSSLPLLPNQGGTTKLSSLRPCWGEGCFIFWRTMLDKFPQSVTRFGYAIISGSALIYCAGLLLLVGLWNSFPDSGWLAVVNIFALYLFAPLILLVPAALLIRSRTLRGAAVATLALFLALFGTQLLPPRAIAATGMPLRVATLNHLYSNQNTDAIITAIRAQNADVVALQELSQSVQQAAHQQLQSEYPYQILLPGRGSNGLGILSRYPLSNSTYLPGFTGLRTTLDLHGTPITLLNVHPSAPRVQLPDYLPEGSLPILQDYSTARRSNQITELLRVIDTISGPLVVLGDFNTSDREPEYAEFARRLHDAYRETQWGFGFTFPNKKRVGPLITPFPLIRIDYIWSRADVRPEYAWVECDNGGSDHCMVIADLRVDRAQSGHERRWLPW